jgi:hypothetical protein
MNGLAAIAAIEARSGGTRIHPVLCKQLVWWWQARQVQDGFHQSIVEPAENPNPKPGFLDVSGLDWTLLRLI